MTVVTTNCDPSQLLHDVQERLLYLEYAREMPGRIDSLSKAVENDDRQLLRRLAHRIKGSAVLYGFPELSVCAAELECMAPFDVSVTVGKCTNAVIALCHDAQRQIFHRFGDQ